MKVLVKFRMESTHYYVVSAAAWELLVAWYGTIQGQPPLPRKLVGAPGSLTVEAYLLDLRLATPEKAQRGEWIVRGFSKEATIREIKAVMAAELELPDDDTTVNRDQCAGVCVWGGGGTSGKTRPGTFEDGTIVGGVAPHSGSRRANCSVCGTSTSGSTTSSSMSWSSLCDAVPSTPSSSFSSSRRCARRIASHWTPAPATAC